MESVEPSVWKGIKAIYRWKHGHLDASSHILNSLSRQSNNEEIKALHPDLFRAWEMYTLRGSDESFFTKHLFEPQESLSDGEDLR